MLATATRPPQKATIVQTLPEMSSGGVERGVLEVGRALVAAGHRSIVISGGGRLVGQLTGEGSEHVEMPIGRKSPTTLRLVTQLRDFIRSEGVDVLHARSRVPGWVALLAWRSLTERDRPKFITTVHGLHSVSKFSSVMTRGEIVIAVSETVRHYIEANYPNCPADRVRVVPRGVDPNSHPYGYRPDDDWIERFLADFPECRRKRLVTLPGRITRLKGHHDFLPVIAGLPEDVHGLIVGGEDPRRAGYADEVRKAVSDRGLSDRVTFTGHRSDIREVIAMSDAVVSLSTKPESFGRTVLEALSLGRPVVGYDHGGVGEILADLFPEGRVPLGDVAAAAASLRGILGDGVVPSPVVGYQLDEMLCGVLDVYEEALRPSRLSAA